MPDISPRGVQPRFIRTGNGRLFTVSFLPDVSPVRSWLFVPPFAEEMNRCRSTVATTARALAAAGHAVTLLDLSGTGESDGDFEAATVAHWLEDINQASRFLAEETGLPTSLWGMRLGATLAATAVDALPATYDKLLLWQPVLKGATYLTQFLRLRVAALMARDLPAEDTKSMRALLGAGNTLEVAGYPLGGPLADGMQVLDIANLLRLRGRELYWVEHVPAPGQDLGPATRKTIDALAAGGCDVRATGFTGAPFWQTHEIVQCPDVTRKTLSILEATPCT